MTRQRPTSGRSTVDRRRRRVDGTSVRHLIGAVTAALVWSTAQGVESPGTDLADEPDRADVADNAGSVRERHAGGGWQAPQLAQFQVAPPSLPGEPPATELPEQTDGAVPRFRHGEAKALPQNLKFQYSLGTESDMTYRGNPDLDRSVKDDTLILGPQLAGYIIYRPTLWFETMLEMTLEKEIAAKEEPVVVQPNGEIHRAPKRPLSLAVDQAFVSFKRLGPFTLTVGRRNFEDDRHWLYDTSLDIVHARYRQGALQAEFSVGRKDLVALDAFKHVDKTRTNNYIAYMDYRGPLDIRYAGYAIWRNDITGKEGKPLFLGVRAYGMPTDEFNFWSELAMLRGKDEANRSFRGYGFDGGATYRFPSLPGKPSITMGYPWGSGEDQLDGTTHLESRQTGLESKEGRMSGIPKFKYYGEALDPELSNIQIFTIGVGFRPAARAFVDLVYHRYRLNRLADQVRGSAITAQMSQVDTHLSKDIGEGIDIVIGLRNLFGIRRLGIDLRAGIFFPGKAYVRNVGTEEEPVIRHAQKSVFMLAKFLY